MKSLFLFIYFFDEISYFFKERNGVPPLNCFPPYGLASHSKPNLTVPPINPKFVPQFSWEEDKMFALGKIKSHGVWNIEQTQETNNTLKSTVRSLELIPTFWCHCWQHWTKLQCWEVSNANFEHFIAS